MERTWKLTGAYADWTLTVSTEPPEIEADYREDWPESALASFDRYFADLVNLLENSHASELSDGMARSGHAYRS